MTQFNPHNVAMGRAVRNAIVEAGLTNAKAAELAGIDGSTLKRRLGGTIPFTWPELIGMAAATGTDLHTLVGHAERLASERLAS